MKAMMIPLLLTAPLALSEPCFGPACDPDIFTDPVGPVELCINDCLPVAYQWIGNLVVASTELPNGYEVLGWSGPCIVTDAIRNCPDIKNQAWTDLRMNVLRVLRAQRY